MIDQCLCHNHLPTTKHAAPSSVTCVARIPNGKEVSPVCEPEPGFDVGIQVSHICSKEPTIV